MLLVTSVAHDIIFNSYARHTISLKFATKITCFAGVARCVAIAGGAENRSPGIHFTKPQNPRALIVTSSVGRPTLKDHALE